MYEYFENMQKLSDHSNTSSQLSIQFSGNNLFYLQNINSDSNDNDWVYTLHSYDLTKRIETKLLNESICSYIIHENWIFFSTVDTKKLYRVNFDGTEKQLINEGDPWLTVSLQIFDNHLFFGWDEAIVKIGFDGVFKQSWCAYPYSLLGYNQEMYYINSRSLNLEKIVTADDKALPDSTTIIENEVVSFTICRNILYYSTIDEKIYKVDLSGTHQEFISNGYAPIVTGDYLFYFSTDNNMIHIPIS